MIKHDTHIQKIVPIPPLKIAKAIPDKLPTPTRLAKASVKLSKGLIPLLLRSSSFILLCILLNLNCGNFNLIV